MAHTVWSIQYEPYCMGHTVWAHMMMTNNDGSLSLHFGQYSDITTEWTWNHKSVLTAHFYTNLVWTVSIMDWDMKAGNFVGRDLDQHLWELFLQMLLYFSLINLFPTICIAWTQNTFDIWAIQLQLKQRVDMNSMAHKIWASLNASTSLTGISPINPMFQWPCTLTGNFLYISNKNRNNLKKHYFYRNFYWTVHGWIFKTTIFLIEVVCVEVIDSTVV